MRIRASVHGYVDLINNTPRERLGIRKGFTLLELLIAISLFLILSLIGVASYSFLVQKNEQKVILDELRTAIQYAKFQAVILDKPVYLTPSDVSFNWLKGIKLSSFNKKNNQMESIYYWQWDHPAWNLSWEGVRSKNQIVFSNNPIQAMSNGHFILTNPQNHSQVKVVLNRLGRLR